MRSIIAFFVKNTIAANVLMVFILIMGLFGLLQINTTFFPEQPSRIINIQLVYPGASPEEMEEGVVTKIEENLIGVKNVKRSSSTSLENAATIIVETERNTDIDLVLQDVKNAVDQISSFPAAMEPPIIFKQEQNSEAYIFALSGNMDLPTLKQHSRQIEDDLLAMDGISNISIQGFPDEEIEISFREQDMQALDITFDEAINAVAQTNLLSTGGTIKSESEEFLIRAKNKNYQAAAFENIVVRSNSDGGVVRLNQIADIKDQWEDAPQRSFLNKDISVIMTSLSRVEEDMFSVSTLTSEYLKSYNEKYPELTITKIRDGKEYLNGRIDFIKKNGLIGFFLVLGLLAMFLNIRVAFWVALAIPISFAGMFLAAAYLGVTINVISTFGMVVVIGILVDDGIVIAENIYQHYERGANPIDAAIEGTMEVLPAVSSAILTTVIAFSAFFFIDGFLGDVFTQLSIVVIFTLIFSLVEGAFILPAHMAHSKALKASSKNGITKFFDNIMNFMKEKIYGRVLNFAIDFPIPTISICIAALIIIVGAFKGGIIKGTFFPFVQSDDFNVSVELPAGARESQVYQILDSIENAALSVNNQLSDKYYGGEKDVIEKVQKTIGPNAYQGSLRFYLLKGEERPLIKNRMVTSAIKEALGPIYEADKLIFGQGNIFGDPISISLLGSNTEQLESAIKELKTEIGRIPSVTDIQDSNVKGIKEVAIQLKPKAHNLGLTLGEIIRYIRQGFFGAEIQRLQRGSDEVKVWVRYATEDRSSISDLSEMRIRTASGLAVPLKELVEFETARGIVSINHLDGQREIRITADVASDKVSVSDINSDIETELLPKILNKYPEVKVGFEGQARDNAETMASMQKVMPLVLLCMFFVIVLTFSSVSQALIVFLLLPFGFIGVGIGHYLMGLPISLLSTLGVIALIGIIVNDALVFIANFNERIKQGNSFRSSLYNSGVSRFRPITLTTITTVAGLLPLLVEKSVQAQFLIPMAVSIAFGLIVSTFILLVLIPALMTLANRIRMGSFVIWNGGTFEAAMVEPAYPNRKHPWFLTLVLALAVLFILGGLVSFALTLTGNLF